MKAVWLIACCVLYVIGSPTTRSTSMEPSMSEMHGKRVLLVVGEESRREALSVRLQRANLQVISANDGEAALVICRTQEPDIVVADFSLPTMSGTAFIADLRAKRGNGFPILVLTDARTGWQGQVNAVKAGANETLHEAGIQELEARVLALLQRWGDPITSCGSLRLDNREEEAEWEGRLLELSAYEYKVLKYLVTHAGQWMSGVLVVEHLYNQEYDRTPEAVNVVAEFIRRLSDKMDPEGTQHPIEISNRGYRISCE
jgi:two-component system, OmpR family, response regulator PhoP